MPGLRLLLDVTGGHPHSHRRSPDVRARLGPVAVIAGWAQAPAGGRRSSSPRGTLVAAPPLGGDSGTHRRARQTNRWRFGGVPRSTAVAFIASYLLLFRAFAVRSWLAAFFVFAGSDRGPWHPPLRRGEHQSARPVASIGGNEVAPRRGISSSA